MRRNIPVLASSGARAASHIALALWIVGFGFIQSADAEVSISGSASALRIETQGATLEEVLRALRLAFKLQYRGTGGLQGVISGTYSGTLPNVLTRLLEGQNFIMHGYPNTMEVIILSGGATANQVVRSAPAGTAPVGGPEPVKECQYKDGDRVIPVEC